MEPSDCHEGRQDRRSDLSSPRRTLDAVQSDRFDARKQTCSISASTGARGARRGARRPPPASSKKAFGPELVMSGWFWFAWIVAALVVGNAVAYGCDRIFMQQRERSRPLRRASWQRRLRRPLHQRYRRARARPAVASGDKPSTRTATLVLLAPSESAARDAHATAVAGYDTKPGAALPSTGGVHRLGRWRRWRAMR